MKKEELLWEYSHEQREIGCSMDQQRSTVTNFIITLTGGLIALITVKGFSSLTIPISVFIVFLGFYGIATTYKFYERSKYHFTRSNLCLEMLDEQIGEGHIKKIKDNTTQKIKKEFPAMSNIKNHQIWLVLHLMIITFGIISLVASICSI